MNSRRTQRHRAHILFVEDSPSQATITREAIVEAQVDWSLHHVVDGVEAMAFLRQEGQHADAPRPDIILLDLNLPRKDGREVLEELRSDTTLKTIPVIVLTTSNDDGDVADSYQLNCNAYIAKPMNLNTFVEAIQVLDQFWFRVVTRPPTEDS
jgi:CheY-like chemotaxis protein